jgi:hypothetical protein
MIRVLSKLAVSGIWHKDVRLRLLPSSDKELQVESILPMNDTQMGGCLEEPM